MTLRLAWFATGKGTSSKLLFERTSAAIAARDLDAEIAVVFCNRERGQSTNTDAFLESVAGQGTPLVTLSSGAWRKRVGGAISKPGESLAAWRADYEEAVRASLASYEPQAAVLAGFMLITPELSEWLPLLNLHPALPDGPVGTWQEVTRALIEERAIESGMMLQRSSRELDRGPVLSSCRYPLRGGAIDEQWQRARTETTRDATAALFDTIRARGVEREPHFLVASLQAVADGRITIPDLAEKGPDVDLTADVEAALDRGGVGREGAG